MKVDIVTYLDEYSQSVKDLLQELQEYIVSIDKEKYNKMTPSFKEKYFENLMLEINHYEGTILLAKIDSKIVGMIAGVINNEEINTYDFKAPKRGRITELIVAKEYRQNKIGDMLLKAMEESLENKGCQGVLISVFYENEIAKRFYATHGYHIRTMELTKKLISKHKE